MKFDCGNGSLWLGDCLEKMRHIAGGSIDMVLCDLPYGQTDCKWDAVIPFEPLWKEYWRICKPNAAIVLTGIQPFVTALVASQIEKFRYDWIWDKVNRITGSLNANKRPMRRHEHILIFSENGRTIYNKQPIMKPRIDGSRKRRHGKHVANGPDRISNEYQTYIENDVPHNPNSILEIEGFTNKTGGHPTQKPVPLFEYLIKTYTNPGDLVLDNCSGGGTTAIAAHNTGRRWLCIEKELEYYLASAGRIYAAINP